jgi:hypothetical protein
MSGFKSAAKRKRELAKLAKRQAKDQERARRKAVRSGADVGARAPTTPAATPPIPAGRQPASGTTPVPKPTTFAEAVEIWKNTKVVSPKR